MIYACHGEVILSLPIPTMVRVVEHVQLLADAHPEDIELANFVNNLRSDIQHRQVEASDWLS